MWSKDDPWFWGNLEVGIFRKPQVKLTQCAHHQDNWTKTAKVIKNIVFFCQDELRWHYYGKIETDMWSEGDSYFGGYVEVDIFRKTQVWKIRWTHFQDIRIDIESVINNIVPFHNYT